MILAVDVDYRADRAWAAGVLFGAGGDARPAIERVVACEATEGYRPGAFFRRELPCIERLLREIDHPVDRIVVDGFVHLGSERQPGLGWHLFAALDRRLPVVGVAKTRFRHTPAATAVLRGNSSRPLYVTAAGMDEGLARQWIGSMHGEYRLPTLLRRVDTLCRRAGRA